MWLREAPTEVLTVLKARELDKGISMNLDLRAGSFHISGVSSFLNHVKRVFITTVSQHTFQKYTFTLVRVNGKIGSMLQVSSETECVVPFHMNLVLRGTKWQWFSLLLPPSCTLPGTHQDEEDLYTKLGHTLQLATLLTQNCNYRQFQKQNQISNCNHLEEIVRLQIILRLIWHAQPIAPLSFDPWSRSHLHFHEGSIFAFHSPCCFPLLFQHRNFPVPPPFTVIFYLFICIKLV